MGNFVDRFQVGQTGRLASVGRWGWMAGLNTRSGKRKLLKRSPRPKNHQSQTEGFKVVERVERTRK